MARGLNVFVNIGARVASSVGASASAVERRMAAMGQRLRLANAEAKAASRGLMSSGDIRGAIFDSAAVGYGLYKAMDPFVQFEDALVRVGNTAEVYGSTLNKTGDQIIATGKKYGIGAMSALEGVNAYIAAGLDLKTASGALDRTLMLSKTAGIDPTEAAAAGVGVMNNMGVKVEELGAAFDRMALAGKRGNFELSAMAKYMPRLTSAAAKMGMTGVQGVGDIAAMLQIVRQGSADEETAQNNLYNLFEKTFSAETVKKFAKAGYNLPDMYKAAQASGTDYFDSILDAVEKLSKKGEDPFAFANTFEDQQAKSALTMLVTKRAEYRKLREEVRAAAGVLEGDWARVNKTNKTSMDRLGASLRSLAISFGAAFGPALANATDKMAKLASSFALFAEQNPKVVSAIGGTVAALAGMLIFAKIGSVIATGVLRIGIALKWLGTVIGAGSALASGLVWLRGATLAFSLFAATLGVPFAVPVLAAAAALVALGLGVAWVVAKWDGIKAFFVGFADGVTKSLSPEVRANLAAFGETLKGVGEAIGKAFDWAAKAIGGLFGPIFSPPKTENWKAFGEEMGRIVGGVINWFQRLFDTIGAVRSALANPLTLGKAAMENLGAGSDPLGNAAPRAYGGTSRAGQPHMVGERGREIFVPGKTGTIIPARTTEALMRGANDNGGSVTIGDIHIHGANDPQSTRQILREELKRLSRGQSALLSD